MTKLDVYLKSGSVIRLDVEEFSMRYENGRISKVAWIDGKSKPLWIQPEEIAAVIEL